MRSNVVFVHFLLSKYFFGIPKLENFETHRIEFVTKKSLKMRVQMATKTFCYFFLSNNIDKLNIKEVKKIRMIVISMRDIVNLTRFDV